MVQQTNTYICPTCGSRMERDILLFYRHTDQHVVDELKKQNPQWISDEGFCPKCLDFFKREMGKGDPSLVNIGVGGARRRTILGIVASGVAITALVALYSQDAPKPWRLALFVPFLGAMLGFIQARERICVVLGGKGVQETDKGEGPIGDKMLDKALRRASNQILLLSLALAAVLTAISLIP